MEPDTGRYIGRFAPTPSGPLHFGSIIAALASYIDARAMQGKWMLRIDDLDTPRVKPGSVDSILSTLECLGLEWDGDVVHQSTRLEHYLENLERLQENGMLYPCYCPRKLTRDKIYPGTCRYAPQSTQRRHALRIKTTDDTVTYQDRVAGAYQHNLFQDTGDFIVFRSDNIFAYDLAAALDDNGLEISHVIRGADLLDSTPKQNYLQKMLGIKIPVYGHIPVATDKHGRKISKRDGATDVKLQKQPTAILIDALQFLGQEVDPALQQSNCNTVLEWAIDHWDLSRIPRTLQPTND